METNKAESQGLGDYMFKIDFIVWKQGGKDYVSFARYKFKIDFIVWKLLLMFH